MTRLGTAMVRLAHKDMADERAMEKQEERAWGSDNPIHSGVSGSGATPSMGLSQIRGGRKAHAKMMEEHDGDAMAQGHALAEHLHKLHGHGYARSFHKGVEGGLGTGRYEGKGCGGMTDRRAMMTGGMDFDADTQHFDSHHMKGGFWLPLLTSVGLPLLGKLLGNGHMNEKCHKEMEKLIKKHEEKYHKGQLKGGFWGALASVGLPLLAKMVGLGHCSQKGHDDMMKMMKRCEKKETTAMKKEMKGAGAMSRCVGAGKAKLAVMPEMEGKGFLSNLGIPIVSDVAGMFGLGKEKKAKRAVSESDGRRKRAEVVRKVMSEKGMSMIQASKYVKEHGLYKK